MTGIRKIQEMKVSPRRETPANFTEGMSDRYAEELVVSMVKRARGLWITLTSLRRNRVLERYPPLFPQFWLLRRDWVNDQNRTDLLHCMWMAFVP